MNKAVTKARKRKVGRPTDYRRAYCRLVRNHLAKGYSLTTACGKIGVHRDTLYQRQEDYPDFSDAVKEGRAIGQTMWEDRLATQAEQNSGNSTAIVFGLKNLYPQDWADRQQVDHRHAHAIAIDTNSRQMARAVVALLAETGESEDSGKLLELMAEDE